jgi:hypothetical protein
MRKSSLIAATTAALLAGTMLAAAQGMQNQSPGTMERGMQSGQERSPGAMQKRGEEQKGPRNRAQGQQKERGTVGQSQQQSEPKARGKSRSEEREGRQPSTRGQNQREERKSGATQERERSTPKARQGQREGGKNGERTQGQATRPGANVNLTSEQRTKVRTTIIEGGRAPRVDHVNFSLRVGTVVPRSVRIVSVPSVLVDIHPAWRGYYYFVVGDQIIIVNRNHHIVAILDV